MSHERSFISSVAVMATFVAAVWFGTEPATADDTFPCPPGSHRMPPDGGRGHPLGCIRLIDGGPTSRPVQGPLQPIPRRVILKTIPKVAQFKPLQGPLQFIPPRIQNPMTKPPFGPPKPMPVSRIR